MNEKSFLISTVSVSFRIWTLRFFQRVDPKNLMNKTKKYLDRLKKKTFSHMSFKILSGPNEEIQGRWMVWVEPTALSTKKNTN